MKSDQIDAFHTMWNMTESLQSERFQSWTIIQTSSPDWVTENITIRSSHWKHHDTIKSLKTSLYDQITENITIRSSHRKHHDTIKSLKTFRSKESRTHYNHNTDDPIVSTFQAKYETRLIHWNISITIFFLKDCSLDHKIQSPYWQEYTNETINNYETKTYH